MKIRPSSFYAQPNEWAANQLGHATAGIIVCYWLSWVWRAFTGELPLAIAALGVWAAIYLLIELPQHGGLWDTIEDILWAVGICGSIVIWARGVFAESPNAFDALFAPMSVISTLLAVGHSIRIWQAHKEGRDI
jgi:hypothetical protein